MLLKFLTKLSFTCLMFACFTSAMPVPKVTALGCDDRVDFSVVNNKDRTTITKVVFDGTCDYQDVNNVLPSTTAGGGIGFGTTVDVTVKFSSSPQAGNIDIYSGTTLIGNRLLQVQPPYIVFQA